MTLDLEPPPDAGSDFGTPERDLGRPDSGSTDLGAADLSRPDMATADLGAEADLGEDGGVCIAAVERCNGLDDDCDDLVDEDYDKLTDLANCGACGRVCTGLGGTPSCVAGACRLECDFGRANCDDDLSNGCETDLSRPGTCGACDTSCDPSAPRCRMDGDAFDCVAICPTGLTLCDGTCVDLETSRGHCGACGSPCFLDPHGSVGCVSGVCTVDSCGDTHDDCNGDASDGCEQSLNSDDHCGSCDNFCAADAICVRNACAIAAPGL